MKGPTRDSIIYEFALPSSFTNYYFQKKERLALQSFFFLVASRAIRDDPFLDRVVPDSKSIVNLCVVQYTVILCESTC